MNKIYILKYFKIYVINTIYIGYLTSIDPWLVLKFPVITEHSRLFSDNNVQ